MAKEESVTRVGLWRQVLVSVSGGLAGITITQAMNFTTFGVPSMEADPDFNITPEQGRWVGSLVPAFGIVGNLAAGLLIDGVGRKGTYALGISLYVVAWVLLGSAEGAGTVLASRALAGVGGGLLLVTMMVYMAETVQPQVKDKIGSIPGLMIQTGTLVSFLSGSVLEWRATAWLSLAMMTPLVIIVYLLPESPPYLISKGKQHEALTALEWLRGSESVAKIEWKKLIESSRKTKESKPSWRELFVPPFCTPMIVALVLVIAQQMSGVTGVTANAVKIFKDSGTSIDPAKCTIMIAVVNIFSSIISGYVRTLYKRKSILFFSTSAIVSLLTIIGMVFWARETDGYLKDLTEHYTLLPFICFLLYFVSFGIGLGPIPWHFLGEGLPSRIRGPGSAIISTFSWIAVFIIMQAFSTSLTVLGYHYTFFILAFLTSVLVASVFPLMMETKGLTITDVDNYYNELNNKKKL